MNTLKVKRRVRIVSNLKIDNKNRTGNGKRMTNIIDFYNTSAIIGPIKYNEIRVKLSYAI